MTGTPREGWPERLLLAVRTPAGARALAVVTDGTEAATGVTEDLAGAAVRVSAHGVAHLD